MSDNGLKAFDRTLEKTHQFINDVAHRLNIEDKQIAFIGVKAVLHALRDRIPADEAVQLGSQLPVLLAGFYYQGWKPAATPTKERSKNEFLAKIRDNLPEKDYPTEIETLARSVFVILAQWVSDGEIDDVINMLPEDVQSLWSESATVQ